MGKTLRVLESCYVSFSLHPCIGGDLQDGVRVYNRGERDGFLFESISGNGPWMQGTVAAARRLAGSEAPVLILGEPGTGKDTLAYSIHLGGEHRSSSFVVLDCDTLTDKQWRALLERGENLPPDGDGLTVYLRHIHRLSPAIQTGLAGRLGQNGGCGCRLIASATVSPERLLERGTYAEALYEGISFMRIHLCPLRERLEDLQDLASSFISQFNEKYDKQIVGLEKDALDYLGRQRWEGNLDQLRQVVEELVLLSDRPYIGLTDAENVLPAPVPRFRRRYPDCAAGSPAGVRHPGGDVRGIR